MTTTEKVITGRIIAAALEAEERLKGAVAAEDWDLAERALAVLVELLPWRAQTLARRYGMAVES